MTSQRSGIALLFSVGLVWLSGCWLSGCNCAPPPPTSDACLKDDDCGHGARCVDGRCASIPGPMTDASDPACEPACAAEELCLEGQCVPDSGPCEEHADCPGDTRCEPRLGRCVPWGVPSGQTRDPMCTRFITPGSFAPTVQCEFREAPPGDPFPEHLHVLSTPMVVDFHIDRGPDDPPRPSIVAVFDDGHDGSSEVATGVIRIIDGATCAQLAELGSLQIVSHSSPVALGDLDGDGRAEIVAYKAEPPTDGTTSTTRGGLVAFTYDDEMGAWRVLWRSTEADGATPYEPTGGGWAGPTLVDLDDDGSPEVLRGAIVFDAMGRLVDDTNASLLDYNNGAFAIVANVDDDPAIELIGGHGVWEWDRESRTWIAEEWATGGQPAGHVAIADFGAFPGGADWPPEAPEVAVVSSGQARVQTLDGQVVFGPVPLPGGGNGGPPTIADFDGDGLPELASAGANAYSVFDPDCTDAPRPGGECAAGSTNGVLWSQRSQDASSNVTGSSVFDFEGDGRAEVVYGDECFTRVYDGETGEVIFSQSRSSCTWYENPVIADVDGDFNAEIVIGDNYNCGSAETGVNCSGFGLGPRNTDPLFAGLRCADASECLSGVCDAGFCRCTSDEECCSGAGCARAAFVCETPPDGTPGTGNTCRASRPVGTRGLRVFNDSADRWVRSRMIWNQHAYHVTNVLDDGRIPRSSEAVRNWRTEGLNNFRQNVQGDAIPGAAPDLTSAIDSDICDVSDGTARLSARVCNRGIEPVGSGVSVRFADGDPAVGGTELCTAATERVLQPGTCESVECVWDAPRDAIDVWVIADADGDVGECREENNVSVARQVRCTAVSSTSARSSGS